MESGIRKVSWYNLSMHGDHLLRGVMEAAVRPSVWSSRAGLAGSPSVARVLRASWIVTRPLTNTKNLAMVLLALYLAGTEISWSRVFSVLLVLSFISSAMLAYNAAADREQDKKIANKARYASAAELLGPARLGRIIVSLLFLGGSVALSLGPSFFLLATALAAVIFAYSSPAIRLKERPVLDVVFGGALTHPLRFAAAWAVFGAGPPPLLAISGLLFAKIGGYLLYKSFDRDDFVRLGVQNSLTRLSLRQIVLLALGCILLAVVSGVLMVANARWQIPRLGILPAGALWLVVAVVPPLVVLFARALALVHWRVHVLRRVGYVYWLVWIAIVAGVVWGR